MEMYYNISRDEEISLKPQRSQPIINIQRHIRAKQLVSCRHWHICLKLQRYNSYSIIHIPGQIQYITHTTDPEQISPSYDKKQTNYEA